MLPLAMAYPLARPASRLNAVCVPNLLPNAVAKLLFNEIADTSKPKVSLCILRQNLRAGRAGDPGEAVYPDLLHAVRYADLIIPNTMSSVTFFSRSCVPSQYGDICVGNAEASGTVRSAHSLGPVDDYPYFVVPLPNAVAAGEGARGVATYGSGGGCVRLYMNVLCVGGRTVGPEVAWDLARLTWEQCTVGKIGTCATWER